MEFHQIRSLLAVCDHMNVTRAADNCGVSQPALTVAIQKLGAEQGGALFLRDGRQIALTALGHSMRTHLGRIEETRLAAGRVAEAVLEGDDARMAAEDIKPVTVLRAEPEDWVQHAVAQGRGVTIAPRDTVVMPGLTTVAFEDLDISRVIEIATVAERPLSSVAARFTRFLAKHARRDVRDHSAA